MESSKSKDWVKISQILANSAIVLGVIFTIIMAIFALEQVKQARIAVEQTRCANNAEVTLRLFEYYESDHMRYVIDYIARRDLKSAKGRLEFEKLRIDREAIKCFYDLANFFEIIATLVMSEEWDPKLAKSLFDEMLIYHWEVCEDVVNEFRELQKHDNLWKPWETYVKKMALNDMRK